jgi:WD40 repeat protein
VGQESGEVFTVSGSDMSNKTLLVDCGIEVEDIKCVGGMVAISSKTEKCIVVKGESQTEIKTEHQDGIKNISISNNQMFIATMGYDGALDIYKEDTRGRVFRHLISPEITESSNAFKGDWAPDDSCFAFPGGNSIRLVKTHTWEIIETNITMPRTVSLVKFGSVGGVVIAGDVEGNVGVYNIITEETLYSTETLDPICDAIWINSKVVFTDFGGKVGEIKDLHLVEHISNGATLVDSIYTERANREALQNVGNGAVIGPDLQWIEQAIGTAPQEPVMFDLAEEQQTIIFWSLLGRIILKESPNITDASGSKVSVEFSDSSFCMNLFFSNIFHLSIASMSESGALFGSKSEEEDAEDNDSFIEDNASLIRPRILFKSLKSEDQWVMNLKYGENPELLAVGSDWCCVFTSKHNLRFFTNNGGIQTYIISLPSPAISLNSFNDELAISYHNGIPVQGTQNLHIEIWQARGMFVTFENEEFIKEEYRVAVSPGETIQWIGYSEEGIICTVDTAGIAKMLWRRVGHWTPVCYDIKFERIVGIRDSMIYGVLDNFNVLKTKTLCIPVLKSSTSEIEESHMRSRLMLDHTRLTESIEESYRALDKLLLAPILDSLKSGESERALGLAQMVILPKTKAILLKVFNQDSNRGLHAKLSELFGLESEKKPLLARPLKKTDTANKPTAPVVNVNMRKIEDVKEAPPEVENPFAKSENSKVDLFGSLSEKRKREDPAPVKRRKLK